MVQRSSTDPAEHTRNDGGPSTTRVRLRAMLSAALVARWFAASCSYNLSLAEKVPLGFQPARAMLMASKRREGEE